MITSQCGKLPCVQRTGSLPQRHYFSILRPRCKGAGRISGKVLAMLGRFCPRFPPSPRRFVKIVGNRPARHVLGPGGVGAQPAVRGYAARAPYIVGRGLAATHKRQPFVRPTGGPMKSSAPTQGTAALHDRHPPAMPASPRFLRPFALHCRAGVHARRGPCGGPKGIGKARRRTPQSADADSSPCRGAFQTAVPLKPPLQGEVDAPQGADGGVHCRFAPQVSRRPRQGLALHP